MHTPAPKVDDLRSQATAVTFDDLDDLDTAPVSDARPDYLTDAAEFGATHGERGRAAGESAGQAAPMVACPKCHGSGRWLSYSGYTGGKCFKCAGTGKVKGQTEAAKRAALRRAVKKVEAWEAAQQELSEKRSAFSLEHPHLIAWIDANPRFEFAASMRQALEKYGYLTENQQGAILKCIARDADRAAAREAAKVEVTGEGLNKIGAALTRARQKGLKNPALVFESVVFKAAKPNSPNAGSLYVTAGRAFGSDYFGKIDTAGVFRPNFNCPEEIKAEVPRICRDPLGEIQAHGRRTGNCACCNRALTDKDSVERGIGPICLEKFFGGGL